MNVFQAIEFLAQFSGCARNVKQFMGGELALVHVKMPSSNATQEEKRSHWSTWSTDRGAVCRMKDGWYTVHPHYLITNSPNIIEVVSVNAPSH